MLGPVHALKSQNVTSSWRNDGIMGWTQRSPHNAYTAQEGSASFTKSIQIPHCEERTLSCQEGFNLPKSKLLRCSLYSGPIQYLSLLSDGSIIEVVKMI